MAKTLLAILLSHLLIPCDNQSDRFIPNHWAVIEATNGSKLLEQCSRSTPQNVTDFWNPSLEEVSTLHINFKRIRDIESTGCCYEGGKITSLKGFGFQYLGVVIDSKKFIYINAFRISRKGQLEYLYENWDSEPLVVCDGGMSFWGALFEINSLIFSDLSFNGIA